jgi:hypothetical protein
MKNLGESPITLIATLAANGSTRIKRSMSTVTVEQFWKLKLYSAYLTSGE